MNRLVIRVLVAGVIAVSTGVSQAENTPAAAPNGFVSPDKAVTTSVRPAAPGKAGLAGYLGVQVAVGPDGKLVANDVPPSSPAYQAGIVKGDVIARVDGIAVATPQAFREVVQARSPDAKVKIAIVRAGKPMEITATLGAISKPMKMSTERLTIGVQAADAKGEDEGIPVERVTLNSPADEAGIKAGDVILRVEGNTLRRAAALMDALTERKVGDVLKLTVRRADKEMEVKVKVIADTGVGGGRFGGGRPGGAGGGRPGGSGFGFGGGPPTTLFTKNVYRLAVVGVEFDDTKHNAKIPLKEWNDAIFSKGTYKKNATGDAVPGSLNDYFIDQSGGAFHIEGKVFDWVAVSKKRAEYSQGSGTSNRSGVASEAVEKLLARDGKDALKDFDGIMVIYAGAREARANRGAVYFPHAGTLSQQGRRLPYLFAFEGGDKMITLSAYCREFAFLLGLPDLAARTENSGSEGAGVYCMLAGPKSDKPQGLSAWAKEQLGWLKPAVIDPTVKQKLVLSPVGSAPNQCVKVLLKLDGSEYFLLENRARKGFDSGLPGEGLLIWRVLNNRPVLEESHGIEGSGGSRVFEESAPYPTKANNAFTPVTTPSSRSATAGGLPVHITEIRRLPDGRITFQIGYEFQ